MQVLKILGILFGLMGIYSGQMAHGQYRSFSQNSVKWEADNLCVSCLAAADFDGDGTYTATLTAGVVAGTATITGTINGAVITDDADVALNVGAAASATTTITA